jgi:YD repeat-containing protein
MPQVVGASPEVSQLMKIGTTSVDFYSGKPRIAIPLFNKNIYGFDYNLALNYDVSGIRPKEKSGVAGRGWILEGSGAVSRTMIDLPDEFLNHKYEGSNHNEFHDVNGMSNLTSLGFDTSLFNIQNGFQPGFTEAYFYNSLFNREKRTDSRRDIYQFNALGRSGQFIFVKDSNGILVPQLIGEKSNYKVEFDTSNETSGNYTYKVIDRFSITDESGVKFIFDNIETTDVQTTQFFKYEDNLDDINNGYADFPEYRSAWKLTRVKSSSGEELMRFEYNQQSITTNNEGQSINRWRMRCGDSEDIYFKSAGIVCPYNWDTNDREEAEAAFNSWVQCNQQAVSVSLAALGRRGGGGGSSSGGLFGGGGSAGPGCSDRLTCNAKAYEPIFSRTITTENIQVQLLERIIFGDDSWIKFEVDNNHPEYVDGNRLTEIKMYQDLSVNQTPYKKYQFNYDPSFSNSLVMLNLNNPIPIIKDGFSVLESIDEIFLRNSPSSQIQKYVFDYNLFPSDLVTDEFGYHKNSVSSDIRTDALAGSLLGITHPTTGRVQYNWESNTYSFKGNLLLPYNEIIQNPDNFLNNTNIVNHQTTFICRNDQNLIPPDSNYQYITVPYDQLVNFNVLFNSDISFIEPYNIEIWYERVDNNNNPIGATDYNWVQFTNLSQQRVIGDIAMEAGKYRVYFKQNILRPSDASAYDYNLTCDNTLDVDLILTWKSLAAGPLNWWTYGGGLRMGSIEYSDSIDNVFRSIKGDKFNYTLEPFMLNRTLPVHGYPMPGDYPGHVDNLTDPIHHFSSGSIDGESSLTRKYFYSKAPLHTQFDPTGMLIPTYFNLEKRSELLNYKTKGSYIGYKNIAHYSEKIRTPRNFNTAVANKGVSKYQFDSPIDYNFHPENYVYPFRPYQSKDYLRGNLRKTSVYDHNNKLIEETKLSYNYDTRNPSSIVARDVSFSLNPSVFSNELNWITRLFSTYSSLVSRIPNSTYNGYPCTGGIDASDFIRNYYNVNDLRLNLLSILEQSADYEMHESFSVFVNNSSKTSYMFDGSETADPILNIIQGSDQVNTEQSFIYNPINNAISETIAESSSNTNLNSKTYYTLDISNLPSNLFTAQEISTYNSMVINANLKTTPIIQESFTDGELTSRVKYTYKEFHPNLFLPELISSQKSDNDPFETRLTYHNYDEYGNVLDVSKQDGTHVSYIYGYNKTLPVAKIEGLSYQDLVSKIPAVSSIQQLIDNIDESDLVRDPSAPSIPALFENLRNTFSVTDPFMITTYEYEIGIGIKKVTDPRGRTMTYHYDDFNRLEYVTDHDGNMLSKNEYKYATQD